MLTMKSTILTITLLLFALPAFAQTPVPASSLATPEPIATATPAPPVVAIIVASVNGGPFRAGSFNIHKGDVMTFKLLPPTSAFDADNPAITVKVNGRDLQFPSGTPASISADEAGVWTVQLDMAGYVSNQITVTAE